MARRKSRSRRRQRLQGIWRRAVNLRSATASAASSPKTRASTKTASPKTTISPATSSAPKSPSSPKARAARSPKSSSPKRSSTTSIRKATASASRNSGTSSPGKFSPATSRTRSAGPYRAACTAAAGFTASPNNRVSIGLVVALEYADPRFDPHAAFQKWKTHPFVRDILDGGKLVRYGAKSLPYGGWYAMPRNYFDGGLIIGDSGSFLDSQRLKGIHLAMKSGMLAAETVLKRSKQATRPPKRSALTNAKSKIATSRKNCGKSAISTRALPRGQLSRLHQHGVPANHRRSRPGRSDARRTPATKPTRKSMAHPPALRFAGDGKLTFDRLTDVYHSGTRHEEDQPCHLHVADLNVCATKCVEEYGNPCQYFCPAAVYEMVKDRAPAKN